MQPFQLDPCEYSGIPSLVDILGPPKKESWFERYHHFRDEFTVGRYACDLRCSPEYSVHMHFQERAL